MNGSRFEFDSRISVSTVLAILMAIIAMAGSWYQTEYRISAMEAAVQEQKTQQKEFQDRVESKLIDIETSIGVLNQRMNDANVGAADPPQRKMRR